MTSQLDSTDPDLQDSDCKVLLKGFYLHDYTTGIVIKTDLTKIHPDGIVYPPNTSIMGPQDVKLSVRHVFGGELHEYEALLGKDHIKDAYVSGEVTTSVGTVTVATGWTVLVGKGPIGDSGWATGSGHGTQMAVRIEVDEGPNPIKHYFYNLERPGKPDTVIIKLPNPEIPPIKLHAGTYAVMLNKNDIPVETDIPPSDEYVNYMCDRALKAELKGLEWPWPPCNSHDGE